jgi:sigma-E factor negative regulatory protein RseB
MKSVWRAVWIAPWLAAMAAQVFMAAAPARAQDADAQDALEWLKKIAGSSRTISYSGVFVYQHGNRVETSRVVHYVNPAGGVFEKLETLDGPPREVIRANDHVTAYLPDARVVLIERRSTQQLPVMLPEKLSDLTMQYEVKNAGAARVSGFDCQWIYVLPRDRMRFGRKFCAEVSSGLPLRAQVLNEKSQIIESFGFSQLTLGGKFSRDQVESRYKTRAQAQRWRVDSSALNISEQAAETGWVATQLPAGFRKSMEVRRTITGRLLALPHLVFTDGLAAISVFVEPRGRDAANIAARPLTAQGAVHIYKRVLGEHTVTALGEAPASTVMQIANSMEPRPVQQQQAVPNKQ